LQHPDDGRSDADHCFLDEEVEKGSGRAEWKATEARSANFSPTAGKITVPTRYAHRVIHRAFGETGVPGKVIPVDEFNTSKTHHVCGEVLQKNMVASNYVEKRVRMVEVGRVRFCAKCGTKQNPESVQRDPNAARNIMKALIAMVHGRDRPQHLCRSRR
jgi:Putative transposase DNA-binding domain